MTAANHVDQSSVQKDVQTLVHISGWCGDRLSHTTSCLGLARYRLRNNGVSGFQDQWWPRDPPVPKPSRMIAAICSQGPDDPTSVLLLGWTPQAWSPKTPAFLSEPWKFLLVFRPHESCNCIDTDCFFWAWTMESMRQIKMGAQTPTGTIPLNSIHPPVDCGPRQGHCDWPAWKIQGDWRYRKWPD